MICPSSGVTIPAMHFSVMLLPQPEPPSSASTSLPASKSTSREKLPSLFLKLTIADIPAPPYFRSNSSLRVWFTARPLGCL